MVLKIISGELSKAHKEDAGFDIKSNQRYVIRSKDEAIVETGLRIQLPLGHVGIVKARSGLSFKHSIECGAGVIDFGYNGEIKVKLYNFSSENYIVNIGDRIAQLVVLPVYNGEVITIDEKELNSESKRAEKGFGSSGK